MCSFLLQIKRCSYFFTMLLCSFLVHIEETYSCIPTKSTFPVTTIRPIIPPIPECDKDRRLSISLLSHTLIRPQFLFTVNVLLSTSYYHVIHPSWKIHIKGYLICWQKKNTVANTGRRSGERIGCQLEYWWFDPWLLQSTCWGVLGEDKAPSIAPYESIGVWRCVWQVENSVWMCVRMGQCFL